MFEFSQHSYFLRMRAKASSIRKAFNSFMTDVSIIWKPVHPLIWSSNQGTGFIYDRELGHEKVKGAVVKACNFN